MKKWISVLLVAVLFAGLFFVGRTSRGTVKHTATEPVQTAGEQSQDMDSDDVSAGNVDENTDEKTEKEPENTGATEDADVSLKIGVVLIGDETEGYSRSHIEGITQAAHLIGIGQEEIEWKERITDSDSAYDAVSELLDDGCNLLIANASIHQAAMTDAAHEYPEDRFVVIGGDNAGLEELDNYYNAYTDIYEVQYLSGVAAGMKLKQLDRKGRIDAHGYDAAGKIRVGYIAGFHDAETISAYTAFYLGMKSVEDNVVLEVQYTNKWMDNDTEATAADALIRSGSPLIAQNTNATGAAETVESAWNRGRHVYYAGCDETVMQIAPNAGLVSAYTDWSVYYTKLFTAIEQEQAFEQDWSGGLKDRAVVLTTSGTHVGPKIAEKLAKVSQKIQSGKLHVFDTAAFTVGGRSIGAEDAMIDLSLTDGEAEASEEDIVKSALVSYDGGAYFAESMLRSAPYFTLHVDGIRELNAIEEP